MNVLVINCGSSSIKYQVLDTDTSSALVQGKIERLSDEASYFKSLQDVAQAVGGYRIDAVGHRVVHGGEHFSMPHLVDDAVLDAIEACIPLAPLHNPANLAGIKAAREIFSELPQVAIFDTAFHSRLPRRALTYAIDPEVATPLKIRRYGFHGISHAYVAQRAAEYLECGLNQLRVVTCHLGNGASACAVEFGTSTETSMGMNPMEGLVMGKLLIRSHGPHDSWLPGSMFTSGLHRHYTTGVGCGNRTKRRISRSCPSTRDGRWRLSSLSGSGMSWPPLFP